jgi:hypothetical protein
VLVDLLDLGVLRLHRGPDVERKIGGQRFLVGSSRGFLAAVAGGDEGVIVILAGGQRLEIDPRTMKAAVQRAIGARLAFEPAHRGLQLPCKQAPLSRVLAEQGAESGSLHRGGCRLESFLAVLARLGEVVQDLDCSGGLIWCGGHTSSPRMFDVSGPTGSGAANHIPAPAWDDCARGRRSGSGTAVAPTHGAGSHRLDEQQVTQ